MLPSRSDTRAGAKRRIQDLVFADQPRTTLPRTEPRPPLRIRASDHIGSKLSC